MNQALPSAQPAELFVRTHCALLYGEDQPQLLKRLDAWRRIKGLAATAVEIRFVGSSAEFAAMIGRVDLLVCQPRGEDDFAAFLHLAAIGAKEALFLRRCRAKRSR